MGHLSGMHYELIYDAALSTGDSWSFVQTGLWFVFLGAMALFVIHIRKRYFGHTTSGYQRGFARFFFGFALIWMLLTSLATWHQNHETASASRSNECTIVEGRVSDFRPMAAHGGEHESYSVQGVQFAYSDFSITGGYNNTVSHGGQITEGSQVRLCYFYRARTQTNIIVRVEIAN
jgi:hypothetical protein